jgi:hypothetical protein
LPDVTPRLIFKPVDSQTSGGQCPLGDRDAATPQSSVQSS